MLINRVLMASKSDYFLMKKRDQLEFRLDFFNIDRNISIFNKIIGKELIGHELTDEGLLRLTPKELNYYINKKMELVYS